MLRLAATLTIAASLPLWAPLPTRADAAEAPYRLERTVPLGAPDRWDYVYADADSHRVFVAHGDRVTVVDGVSGRIVGDIAELSGGTHGIAIVAGLDRGYTDDGRAGIAASFDLGTLQIQHRIPAGADADGIVFDPVSGHLFVIDGEPGTVTVIDPRTDTVLATAVLGSRLEFGVAGGDGKLYVNSVEQHEIVRLDTRTNAVDAHWPMPACERPHGLAIDPLRHLLFAGCANSTLSVVDTTSGSVIANVPIGLGNDAVAFDPRRRLVFSPNGQDGTLSIIRERGPKRFETVATLPTERSARTIAIDVSTGRLYLVAADIDPSPPDPAATGRARPRYLPGSLKLLILAPQRQR
jgi:DNA-binding beta-propeller fold protein YncE